MLKVNGTKFFDVYVPEIGAECRIQILDIDFKDASPGVEFDADTKCAPPPFIP